MTQNVNISSVCRIILDDVNDANDENAENHEPSTSRDQINQAQVDEPDLEDVIESHEANAENIEPSTSRAKTNQAQVDDDLIEVIDADEYVTEQLKLMVSQLKKELVALKNRIVLLENNQPNSTEQNGQPVNVDEQHNQETCGFTDEDELNISALGSFINDSSFTALDSVLNVTEIAKMLQPED